MGVVSVHLGEQCDDGNTMPDDYCSNDCLKIGSCGDGLIQESAGEVCDGDTTTIECLYNCRVAKPIDNDDNEEDFDAGVADDPMSDAELNRKMTQLYIFDIDGTLLAAGGAGTRAINHVFETHFGYENMCRHLSFAGATDKNIFAQAQMIASEASGKPQVHETVLFNAYAAQFEHELEKTILAWPMKGSSAFWMTSRVNQIYGWGLVRVTSRRLRNSN